MKPNIKNTKKDKQMRKIRENKKIIIIDEKTKGYEIKNVVTISDNNTGNSIKVYTSKDRHDLYMNSKNSEKEVFINEFNREIEKVLKDINNDIDTQLCDLYDSLGYAMDFSYEQMRKQIQRARQHIKEIREHNRKDTQSKLNEVEEDEPSNDNTSIPF